jgi:hypothetical protein
MIKYSEKVNNNNNLNTERVNIKHLKITYC